MLHSILRRTRFTGLVFRFYSQGRQHLYIPVSFLAPKIHSGKGSTLKRKDTVSGETTLLKVFWLPSEKGSTLKGKNLLPVFGANSFLLEYIPFSEGGQNTFDGVIFPEIVSIYPKLWSYTFCCKKGAKHIPYSPEKGDIRHAHPYYAIYRKLPSPLPLPPPPTPFPTELPHRCLFYSVTNG